MSAIWTERPEIQVTAGHAHAWGYVTPLGRAWFRTVRPGIPNQVDADRDDHYRRSGRPPMEYVYTEPVPALGVVTLRPRPADSIPDMDVDDWTYYPGTSQYWREIRTEVTRQRWLKYGHARSYSAAYSSYAYHLDPGIVLRIRTYETPQGYNDSAYVGIGFTPSWWTTNDNPRLALRFPRTVDARLDGQPWDMRPSAATFAPNESAGPVVSIYESGWRLDVAQTVTLRIRMMLGTCIVDGPALSQPWVFDLPSEWDADNVVCRPHIYFAGGMGLFHLTQLYYYPLSGYVRERNALDHPYLVPGTGTLSNYEGAVQPVGTSVTVSGSVQLRADLLSVSQTLSPKLVTMGMHEAAVTGGANGSGEVVSSCTRIEATYTYEGRHQECRLWFHDYDRTNVDAFEPNAVVEVRARWGVDDSLKLLFRGRVADPEEYERLEDDERSDPHIVLVDDAVSLEATSMALLTGSFAGVPFRDAVAILADAAGIASSRVNTESVDTLLRADDPDTLNFREDESAFTALETICRSRGFVWWFDEAGDLHCEAPPEYTAPVATIQDGETAPQAIFTRIAHERSVLDGYCNTVHVISKEGGSRVEAQRVLSTAVTTDSSDGFVGHHFDHVEVEDTDNPFLRAREILRERSSRRAMVSWSQPYANFESLIWPRQYVTTGTIDGVRLERDLRLLVRQVRLIVDCSRDQASARAQYVAQVEDADAA
jgi:hypothetical protein